MPREIVDVVILVRRHWRGIVLVTVLGSAATWVTVEPASRAHGTKLDPQHR